jgi:membrane protein
MSDLIHPANNPAGISAAGPRIERPATLASADGVRWMWRIGRILVRRADEDSIFIQAAALAYNTLFSLLPMFALLVIVISVFGGSGSDRGSLTQEVEHWTLNQLGLNELKVSTPNPGPSSSTHPAKQTSDVAQMITDRVQDIQQSMKTTATGFIIFGTLLWGTVSLMLAIERAFAKIYRARRQRGWVERIMLYTTTIAVGPVAAALSIYCTNAVSHLSAGVFRPAWSIAQFAASVVLSTVALLLMYRIIPPLRVPWRSAALGAIVAALLWELGKILFGVYVKHAVGYGRFYGNLALVPLFMFWIYCTWCFVLFGLEVAYVNEHFPALMRRFQKGLAGESGLTDIRWVLPLALILQRSFVTGKVLTATHAADELNLSEDAAEALLNGLKNADLAHFVDSGNGFALARPAEQIKVSDLLAAARHASRAPSGEVMDHEAMESLHKLEHDWATKLTLAELAQ